MQDLDSLYEAMTELMRDHALCFSAAEVLADLIGIDRSLIEIQDVPELSDPSASGERVELICDVGGRVVAFEHTLIESFEFQIRDGAQLQSFVTKVRENLVTALPKGTFTLAVDSDAVFGLKGKEAHTAASELAAWISEASNVLASGDMRAGRASWQAKEPLSATLWFRAGTEQRELQFGRWVPDDLETKRADRLAEAFRTKLPKLEASRKNGYGTCLVLEDRDIPLANVELIADAAAAALPERDRPDWILLVESYLDPLWWLPLFADGVWADPARYDFVKLPLPKGLSFDS